jgi:hypothetical protein
LGHRPGSLAEVLVRDEFGELDPGVDLFGRRVVGSCRIPRAMPMAEASGSTPWKMPFTKSSMICCRSRADSRANLCMSSVSSIVLPRLATVLSTARRSRRVRICASSRAT